MQFRGLEPRNRFCGDAQCVKGLRQGSGIVGCYELLEQKFALGWATQEAADTLHRPCEFTGRDLYWCHRVAAPLGAPLLPNQVQPIQ